MKHSLRQINSVHTLLLYLYMIHYHLLPGLPSCLFPSAVPTKTMHAHLPIHPTWPTQLVFVDLITTVFGEECTFWCSSLHNFLWFLVTPPPPFPPHSQTPSAHVLPVMWETKFHPYVVPTRQNYSCGYVTILSKQRQLWNEC